MTAQQKITRLPDWRARLADYLAEVAGRRFRPGSHDCALFAAGAVAAMTGHDLAAEWRGKYLSLGAGRAMLRARGYADHIDLASEYFRPVSPALAQVGDLAVLPGDLPAEAGALGVVQGAAVYALRPQGLVTINRLHMKRAFRV